MAYRAKPEDGVCWITGASSGIGRAVALELARRGWKVAATARRQEELESLAREAAGLVGSIVPFAGDVADEADMAGLVERIEAELGPVALAFFNAGIADYVRAGALSVAAFRKIYDVNVFGIVHGLAPLLPRMIARGKGQVALNASLAGWRGLPRAAAYASSKAAVINLAECLKFDLDKVGIGIQVVSPGFVATPMTARNDAPMPFLVSVDDAARRICDGFSQRRFEITFPRRLVFVMRLLGLMPRRLYFNLIGKTTGGRKAG